MWWDPEELKQLREEQAHKPAEQPYLRIPRPDDFIEHKQRPEPETDPDQDRGIYYIDM